jgi:hypothetical protein
MPRALLRPALPVLAALGVSAAACGRPPAPRLAADAGALRFVAESHEVGLAPYYWRGRLRDGKIITSVGGAVAWADFDGDGDPDLFLTQGPSDPDDPSFPEDCGRLLRNESGNRFLDVTAESGVRSCGWGMGILWEDLDGDGRVDLFLTAAGPDQLWRQREDGTFRELPWGSSDDPRRFSTGAAALDADRDGDLDLYVAGYIDTSLQDERDLPPFRIRLLDEYEPVPDRLWINQGDATFLPAPEGALEGSPGRGLTVVAGDLDEDGLDDVFVANDRDENLFHHGRDDGTFEDRTAMSGVGLGLDGSPQAGMGVALGDVDRDGRPDLVVSNFADEPVNLYRSLGDGVLVDESRERALFGPTRGPLGWATELVDFDLDGHEDLYVTNGHLLPPSVARIARWRDERPAVHVLFRGPYRQPVLLFRGGPQRFSPEPAFDALVGVWRGGAVADVDLDGRPDLLLYSSDRRTPSLLLWNRSERRGAWFVVTSGPEATLRSRGLHHVEAATERESLRRFVVSGSGYLSASSQPLAFGLGPAQTVDLTLVSAERPRRMRRLPADRGVVLPPAPGPAPDTVP